MGTYLRGIEGGNRKEESVKQKLQQVKYLLKEGKVLNMEQIFQTTTFWPVIQYNIDNNIWKADTGRFYLQTLKDFFEFLLECDEFNITADNKSKLTILISKISKWKKSLNVLSKEQKMVFKENELVKVASSDKITKFLQSKHYQQTVELVKKIDKSENYYITRTIYVRILRTIITILTIRTPKRSGILGQILLADYFRKKDDKDGNYLIRISNHKTAKVYGDSILPLNKVHCEWIDIYINKLRSKIPNLKSKKLFVKFNGSSVSHVDVCKGVSNI